MPCSVYSIHNRIEKCHKNNPKSNLTFYHQISHTSRRRVTFYLKECRNRIMFLLIIYNLSYRLSNERNTLEHITLQLTDNKINPIVIL